MWWRFTFYVLLCVVLCQKAWSCSTESPWLIILVHGNMDLKPHIFSWDNLSRFMRDDLIGSAYLEAVSRLRADSFFYQHHAMQGLGMQKVDEHKIVAGYAAGAFAQAHTYITHTIAPSRKCHYYTFGWSGLQSACQRLHDAQLLYKALIELVQSYRKRGVHPKICLVGYSHGANVVLNVGGWYKKEDEVVIDEAILIGVPVIPESDIYITSPIFKKIFNVYSMGDRVQPIDCLSWKRFLSGRVFSSRKDLIVPEHLYQIRICVKRIARTGRTQHIRPYQTFKAICPALIRKADPGHIELWSFGWANSYRPYFPLYPLPLGVYCTLITDFVKKNADLGTDLTLTLMPYSQSMVVERDWRHKAQGSFLTQEQLEYLQNMMQPFVPLDYSPEIFINRVQGVLQQVAQERELLAAFNSEPQI